MGIAATGKKVAMSEIVLLRFAGGRFVEAWQQFDLLGLMRQIGALPAEQ